MNFAKPGWIAWGNCSKCGRRFDTRRHTRALCPKCDRVISPRITRRESLESELKNYLSLYDKDMIPIRGRSILLYTIAYVDYIIRNVRGSNIILSEYSYYYPYC